jgi:hypothetical protein
MESSEKVIPNVKMDLGFFRLKIRTSCLFLSSSRNFGKEERKSRNEKGHFLHVRFAKGIRKGKQNGLRFQDSFRHNRCHMLSPV